MKKAVYLLIGLLLMNYSNLICKDQRSERDSSPGDSIIILSTPDLNNISNAWASEYAKLNPEIKLRILITSDSKMFENLSNEGKIGITDSHNSVLNNESIFRIVVGRDILVPVTSAKNPFLAQIGQHGLSQEDFIRFFDMTSVKTWGTLLSNTEKSSANYYWINNKSINRNLVEFLKTDESFSNGREFSDMKEMISALQKDPYSFGFCRIVDILDLKNQSIVDNIKLISIDRNGNGLIDYNEKIYDDFNTFTRGVWIGKYPRKLITNIYSLFENKPGNETVETFLRWVLTDGQQFLYGSGYSDLLLSERQTTLDKLYNSQINPITSVNDKSIFKGILIFLIFLILTGFIIDSVYTYVTRRKGEEEIKPPTYSNGLDENMLIVPRGIYFDKTHTWAFMEQNGIVKVGIDDFLQHITGTITRIRMKEKGNIVKKGDQIFSIVQNGKQLNLYAPVSGKIVELNSSLDSNSSIMNTSPYNDGWVYKMEPTNWLRESQLLFMSEKQKQHIKNEFSRLKEFLINTLTLKEEKYFQVILQEGGQLKDGILSKLGPEVWEEFQTKFIDPSRQIWFYEIM